MPEFKEVVEVDLWSALKNGWKHLGLYQTCKIIVESSSAEEGKVLLAMLKDHYE